jgi:hypothetical protein
MSLQLSVAVAVPRLAWIAAVEGLQPMSLVAGAIVIDGAMVSVVQVAVLLTTVVLPQLSMAVKIRVVPLMQPILKVLSFCVKEIKKQLSLAVAVPRSN